MASSQAKKYDNPVTATLSGITSLFRKQKKAGELKDTDRLDGKRILITGASSGLGLAAAKALATRGAEVIMAVRSGIPEKGEEVKKTSGNSKVTMVHVDLSDFSSIRTLVDTVGKKTGPIDILICNAAVVALKARKTKDGLDEMFTVNYLAKFVLVNQLLTAGCFRRENGRIPRIIFVSSESHRNPESFEWDTFGQFQPFGPGKTVERYGYYKLLLTTFAQELERRLNANPTGKYSVFAHCPGPINSNIAREAPVLFQPLLKLTFSLFFRSPEKACEPLVYQAASSDLEGRKFDYLFLMSRKAVDAKAKDPENGKKLWAMTTRLLRDKEITFSFPNPEQSYSNDPESRQDHQVETKPFQYPF